MTSGHEPASEGVLFDTGRAHMARVYDYWLGGKDNYAADRAVAEQVAVAYPDIRIAVRAQRAFLARAVHFLVTEAGISQFLDIGTGLPSANNTHQVAQRAAPQSRVVYVDNDPIVLAHARALLASCAEGATAYIDADLRDTAAILERAADTLDFGQPVAVMLLGILQGIPDKEEPGMIIARLMDAVPPGSYLALTQIAADVAADEVADGVQRYNQQAAFPVAARTHAAASQFFAGLDLLEPGLVQAHRWRPAAADPADDRDLAIYAGIGRKPLRMTISSPGAAGVTRGEGASLAGIARSLEPLIREHAEAVEEGRVPPELVEALYDSGVFRAMLPLEVGGLEAEPVEWLRMIEELARLNGSVGWLAFINSGVGLTFLDPERFERFRVRAGGRLILAMSLGRMGGKASRVDGGYRISGRWPFASGSPFATWLGGMSAVCGPDGTPLTDPNGQPRRLLAIWPADQARLIDTWDGLGLRGTGSGDFEIADLFVPDEQVNPGFYGPPCYDRALFRIKEMPEVGHGAHALGIASAALGAFTDAVNARPAQGSARQAALGHVQSDQIAFARADALVRAARALLHETVRSAYQAADANPELPLELRVRLREANIFAVRAAKGAVGLIFDMAGSGAVYRGRPIERAFRDISTAANHTNYLEAAYASVGSYFLTRDREGGPEIAGRPFF